MRRLIASSIATAAATAALLGAAAVPAGALSDQDAVAQAVTGKLIQAPRAEALVKHLPVKVAFRVPRGARVTKVRVGGHDVTSRFPASGSPRVANLTRGDGLRYGRNQVSVRVERGGGRPVTHARSFVLARRDPELVNARIETGPVTSLDVQMAGAGTVAAEHYVDPEELKRRLSVVRRDRIFRASLNGRSVAGSLDLSGATRATGSLSASHGLRHGVNRLRILVAEPHRGRYVSLTRRFRVPGNRHLPSAGQDQTTSVGGSVRLDGSRSRAAGGGPVDHIWRIISAPPGSEAELRRADSARPTLTPDVQGRYVVGLTVSDGATDQMTLTSGPTSLLLPFKGLTTQGGRSGIQIGESADGFHANPGGGMQWLTLDRATLTPTGAGNNYFDGTAGGAHGISALTSALCHPAPGNGCSASTGQLVIFSYRPGVSSGPPVQPDQVSAFNQVMQTIGVDSIDPKILTAQDKKLVIVGVPWAGADSGQYTHGGGSSPDALAGWLMPDAAGDAGQFQFRLQPEQPAFNLSASKTATTNAMEIRDQRIEATLPSPATGGFQVALVDPMDFTVVDHQVFGTNGVPEFGSGLEAMADYLNAHAGAGLHVAVQSIGTIGSGRQPSIADPSHDLAAYPWYQIGAALSAYGANPHTFNTAQGSYAFLGGPTLEREEVAESSSAVQLDPFKNPRVNETGTLAGRTSMRSDGPFMPRASEGRANPFEDSLHDIVFRPSTPWPYTPGGEFPQQTGCDAPGTDTTAYAKALAFIARGIDMAGYQSDLRRAYVQRNQSQTWSDQKVDLAGLQFESGQGFTKAEFCNLKAELQQEFDWLDNVHGLFDSFTAVLGTGGGANKVQSIGNTIRQAVTENETGPEIGWSVGGFLGNLGSAVILGVFPEATPELAAWEALVTAYELVRELVSDLKGAPIGDQVTSKVQDLEAEVANNLTAASDGLYRLRQVISSDYGRLKALGPASTEPQWNVDVPDATTSFTAGTGAFFYSELIPIPYGVHAIYDDAGYPVYKQPWGLTDATLDTCSNIWGTRKWNGIPDTAWVQWVGDFDRNGYRGWFPTTFALGVHEIGRGVAYPPKAVTDPAFAAISQGGTGMQLADFMWQQYDRDKGYPPTDVYACWGAG